MFHVERTVVSLKDKGIIIVLSLFFLLSSCVGAKQTIQVPDYILVPNGKEVIGNKALTAFIFENNQTKLPIEQYLSNKFKTDNYSEKEFWVTIEKDKYKIIIYDNSEFEKYFNSANYAAMNVETDAAKKGDLRKFIAISMINSYNEDCLSDKSLFQHIATNYLRNLKNEFYNQ